MATEKQPGRAEVHYERMERMMLIQTMASVGHLMAAKALHPPVDIASSELLIEAAKSLTMIVSEEEWASEALQGSREGFEELRQELARADEGK